MFKRAVISMFVLVFVATVASCTHFYTSMKRLETSYNVFIIQQLLLLEKKDIKGSQSLMSSYIKNVLISINVDNELLKYESFCSNWSGLKNIISKHTKVTIDEKHLTKSEQEIISKSQKDFEVTSRKLNNFCSNLKQKAPDERNQE